MSVRRSATAELKRRLFLAAVLASTAASLPLSSTTAAGREPQAARASIEPPQTAANQPNAVLPPLPPGVEELKFSEFFKMPVGRFGLEPTEKLLRLDGQKVRILGYMARQEQPFGGVFIVAALPVATAEAADGPADDLPPSVVFVHMPPEDAGPVPYTPGPLLLTGTLRVGHQDEESGRVSLVRLQLDPPQGAGR